MDDMKKQNLASFLVTTNVIQESLHMPDNSDIVGVEWDFNTRSLRLFVECPELPEIEQGKIVPSIKPTISCKEHDGVRVYDWHWNI